MAMARVTLIGNDLVANYSITFGSAGELRGVTLAIAIDCILVQVFVNVLDYLSWPCLGLLFIFFQILTLP